MATKPEGTPPARRKQSRAEDARARLAAVRLETAQQDAVAAWLDSTARDADWAPMQAAEGGVLVAEEAAEWAAPDDDRTDAERLRDLLANGIAQSFDLAEWCGRDSCSLCRRERLELILTQCRPEVVKLFVRTLLTSSDISSHTCSR